MEIDSHVYQSWLQAYVEGDYEDSHQKFSELLGVDRQDAKKTCYIVIWNSRLLSRLLEMPRWDGETR